MNFRQGTDLQSIHVCDFDPTVGVGVPGGTPYMLLLRTDTEELYYYDGPLDTDWRLVSGGGVGPPGPPGPIGPVGPSSSILSLYGDGSFGNYTTVGNENWTSLLGSPGAPAVPAGVPFPFAFFDNLTIRPGDSVVVGGLNSLTDFAVVVFVKDTLTIGAGGNINANGSDAAPSTIGGAGAPGLGRDSIINSFNGGNGAQGVLGPSSGSNGNPSGDQPALNWALMNNLVGGRGGNGGVEVGGTITQSKSVSWSYSLSQAISIASLLYAIGGGDGGGAGGSSDNGTYGGSGGGGGGTLVIFAKKIIAPVGSIQCKGGAGNVGFASEPQPGSGGGGGGGGCGGSIIIVTEETSLVGLCDVSGGVGGTVNLDSGDATVGTNGNPGAIIAINPTLLMQIPV